MRQTLIYDLFWCWIFIYFFSILSSSNKKLKTRNYNFHIKTILIWRRIKELWFFESSVSSRHSRLRDKTIPLRQREWRDKLFHVKNAFECAVSCRANACGATTFATNGSTWCKIFSGAVNIKIFIKKYIFLKKNPMGAPSSYLTGLLHNPSFALRYFESNHVTRGCLVQLEVIFIRQPSRPSWDSFASTRTPRCRHVLSVLPRNLRPGFEAQTTKLPTSSVLHPRPPPLDMCPRRPWPAVRQVLLNPAQLARPTSWFSQHGHH
jgi:hypothetical protein